MATNVQISLFCFCQWIITTNVEGSKAFEKNSLLWQLDLRKERALTRQLSVELVHVRAKVRVLQVKVERCKAARAANRLCS